MKPASFLLLTLLLFFLYSNIAGQNIDSAMYCQAEDSFRCILLFYPHCASDDETYVNKCAFCRAYIDSGNKLQLRHIGICWDIKNEED